MNKPIDVVEIFKSVNGEGDELGHRTIFVRTFGCSAGCPGCDTPYSWGKRPKDVKQMLAQEIVDFCKPYKIKHITFTGGEPFEQPNMYDVINYLIQQGFHITVETNGIHKPQKLVADFMHVVVSPKPWMLVDKNRDSYFYWARMDATFKFAGTPDDVQRIRKWYKIFRLQKAYIQPWIDPKKVTPEDLNTAYLDLLEEVHKQFNNGEDIRVVPQFHKYIWKNKRGV